MIQITFVEFSSIINVINQKIRASCALVKKIVSGNNDSVNMKMDDCFPVHFDKNRYFR